MANIQASIKGWSTTEASNQPDSTDATTLVGDLRAIQAGIRYYFSQDTIASAATTDLGSKEAGRLSITGTTTITALGTVSAGIKKTVVFAGALTLTHNGTSLILPGAANITTAANDRAEFESLGSGNWICNWYQRANGQAVIGASVASDNTWTGQQTFRDNKFSITDESDTTKIVAFEASSITTATTRTLTVQDKNLTLAGTSDIPVSPVRQTIYAGPVDSSGYASFGGSTGSTTVTASGTLYAAAANQTANRYGSISNPSWTGLSTNGTMYLYLTVNADGTCTTGSTTLAPTYQWGGTYSTTNNQHTFNIQEMTMKVGDGAAATQTYRVFVGEVTVAGGVVTVITWYALMGRYVGTTATLAINTSYALSHNIGVLPHKSFVRLVCDTTNLGYAVGDEVDGSSFIQPQSSANSGATGSLSGRNTFNFVTASANPISLTNLSTRANGTVTMASWKMRLYADRGW